MFTGFARAGCCLCPAENWKFPQVDWAQVTQHRAAETPSVWQCLTGGMHKAMAKMLGVCKAPGQMPEVQNRAAPSLGYIYFSLVGILMYAEVGWGSRHMNAG